MSPSLASKCASQIINKRENFSKQGKIREDPFKNKFYEYLQQKIDEKDIYKSIDPIPYDKVLQTLGNAKDQQYSRFEAFLKFEMEEKEVIKKEHNSFEVEFKDKLKGKMHYSLPGEWIKEKEANDRDKI